MEPNIVLGDLVGNEDLLPRQFFGGVRQKPANEGAVNRAVDHDMGHVDALRTQFASETLRQRPERVLRAGEGGKAGGPADTRGRAREQHRTAAAFDHSPRRLAACEEPRERRHLPNLGIDPRRRLDDRETHIGADIEDEHLDRADLALDPFDERRDIVFDARVEPARVSLATLRTDRLSQLVDRLGISRPPGDADAKALAREGVRDRGAEPIACPDDKADAAFTPRLGHELQPALDMTRRASALALKLLLRNPSRPQPRTSHQRPHAAETADHRDDRADSDEHSERGDSVAAVW